MNFVDKMKRAFMIRVKNAGMYNNRATGFRRKLKGEKRKRKFRGGLIAKIRSALWLKRNFTDNQCRARLYKRCFRGIVGRLSWTELDRMFPRPKAAPRRKMTAKESEQSKVMLPIPKKGFIARLAEKVSNAIPFRKRGMA